MKYIVEPCHCKGCIYQSHWGRQHICCNAYLETRGKKRPEADESGHCKHYTPKGRKKE